ncbi:DUF418 domain-containing protein [Peribacillus deserti]|uniref:DUF418 domain-containing protein n=1 Tax=Peribacillus deserti TaxID=673318 RepID=A0A2N5M7T8_9BACI|nr:DUF418 domain-containing protein [Peribacillus deserti]PLT30421.1 hypothetical protein CUU66_08090 [Peribacillus deserti]
MSGIREQDRIMSIDILRGFSILGIFLVNMPYFHSPSVEDPLSWWPGKWNRILYAVIDILAQASFYPLFAFLFGFGAVIISERTSQKGLSFPSVFSRRLIILLFIGGVHAFLIWHGDILINYALFGFVFLLFYKKSGRKLMNAGAVMTLLFTGAISLLYLAGSAAGEEVGAPQNNIPLLQHSMQIYQHGTFSEITSERFNEWYKVNNPMYAIILFLSIFPLFLIGAGFAKLKYLSEPGKHEKSLKRIFMAAFAFGFTIKLLPYFADYNYFYLFLQDNLGGPLVSIGYIAGLALLLEKKKAKYLLRPFSFVGRLSLSNYLFQSILCTFLFYSYGLGLYGSLSFIGGTLLALAIFIIQVFLSFLWLRHFRMGPVEYVWRIGTYGTLMRKNKAGEHG